MSATVRVEIAEGDDGWLANVTVDDGATTEHRVTVREDAYDALTNGDVPPEELVRASFAFLLERESQQSILPRFELDVISRYFPEYPTTIRRYFKPPE